MYQKIISCLVGCIIISACASSRLAKREARERHRVEQCRASIRSLWNESSLSYKFKDIYDSMQGTSYQEFLKRAKSTEGRVSPCVLHPSVDENDLKTAYTISLEISSYLKDLELAIAQRRGRAFYGCEDVANEENQKLQKCYQKIQDLGKNIYNAAQEKEEKDFHSKTGFYMDLYNWFGNNTLTSYMINSYVFRPQKGYIYDLQRLEVFQRVPGGYLLVANIGGYDSEVIFLKTKRYFIVGTHFNPKEAFVTLTGTQRYTTLLGAEKEVFTFRLIDTKTLQKWLKPYLFYPYTSRKDIVLDPKLVTCY